MYECLICVTRMSVNKFLSQHLILICVLWIIISWHFHSDNIKIIDKGETEECVGNLITVVLTTTH